jgi:hypothetical protein
MDAVVSENRITTECVAEEAVVASHKTGFEWGFAATQHSVLAKWTR